MLGFGASFIPQRGYTWLSTMYSFLTNTLLINAGIHVDAKTIIASLLSPQYVQDMVTEHAVDTYFFICQSILDNPYIYAAFDKGNKKENKNLAKFLCWYDRKKKEVCTFLIDVDYVDEDIDAIFDGIIHSLRRFF